MVATVPSSSATAAPTGGSSTRSSSSATRRGSGGGGVKPRPASSSSSSRTAYRRQQTPTALAAAGNEYSRPPLLVEIGRLMVSFGYVGSVLPNHCQALPPLPKSLVQPKSKTVAAGVGSANDWYRYLTVVLSNVFSKLGQDPADRRVIVLMSGGSSGDVTSTRNYREGLTVALKSAGVPAMRILGNSMEMIPWVFPHCPSMLIIAIQPDLEQAECMAHAAGRNLPYTYQSVPLLEVDDAAAEEEESTTTGGALSPPRKHTTLRLNVDEVAPRWLDETCPTSLVTMVLKCIESCPVDTRKEIVSHMVVASCLGPEMGRRLAKQVQTVLKNTKSDETSRTSTAREEEQQPEDPANAENVVPSSSIPQPPAVIFTAIPVQARKLRSLADHVRLIDLPLARGDLWGWIGTSVWAQHWHSRDSASPQFRWKNLKENKTKTTTSTTTTTKQQAQRQATAAAAPRAPRSSSSRAS